MSTRNHAYYTSEIERLSKDLDTQISSGEISSDIQNALELRIQRLYKEREMFQNIDSSPPLTSSQANTSATQQQEKMYHEAGDDNIFENKFSSMNDFSDYLHTKREQKEKDRLLAEDMENPNNVVYTPAGETVRRFHNSQASVRCIRGPISSGKTAGCCVELISKALQTPADKFGKRRFSSAIVKDRFTTIKATVLPTYLEWLPNNQCLEGSGVQSYTGGSPIIHKLLIGDEYEIVVYLTACRKEEDIIRIKSTDFSMVYINEVQSMELPVISACRGRSRRFPPMKDAPKGTRPQDWFIQNSVIMDCNSGYKRTWLDMYENHDEWRKDPASGIMQSLESIPVSQRWEFFCQPSGLSPVAENVIGKCGREVGNPPDFYESKKFGTDPATYERDVLNQYTLRTDGLPVYKDIYSTTEHVINAGELKQIIKDREGVVSSLAIGIDPGIHPAGTIAILVSSVWYVIKTIAVKEDEGLYYQDFLQQLKDIITYELKLDYKDAIVFIDPASNQRHGSARFTYFEMTKKVFYRTKISGGKSNDPVIRINALSSILREIGHRGRTLRISTDCSYLMDALEYGYIYKKHRDTNANVSYQGGIDKTSNNYHHIVDATQYLFLGLSGREGQSLTSSAFGFMNRRKPPCYKIKVFD